MWTLQSKNLHRTRQSFDVFTNSSESEIYLQGLCIHVPPTLSLSSPLSPPFSSGIPLRLCWHTPPTLSASKRGCISIYTHYFPTHPGCRAPSSKRLRKRPSSILVSPLFSDSGRFPISTPYTVRGTRERRKGERGVISRIFFSRF